MLTPTLPKAPLHLLCIGAHADDIEIGAGGTVMGLLAARPGSSVTWVVATAPRDRAAEARASAEDLIAGGAELRYHELKLSESYLDRDGRDVKEALVELRSGMGSAPDVVFTHVLTDRHQDHRTLSDITWQLWRDHLILEYEIPKWDGDLGQPNVYIPLAPKVVERKLEHLDTHFASQRGKDWYDRETFSALMRLRGMECRSPSRYAEAFHGRKVVLSV